MNEFELSLEDIKYLNELIALYGEIPCAFLPSETCISYLGGELQII